MTGPDPSAASHYKEILAEITDVAAVQRDRDRRRADQIRQELIRLDDDMQRAGERARLTGAVVQLHWEGALDLLWAEAWLKLRPQPGPDPRADPDQLDAYDAEVHSEAELLGELVRRRWYEIGR